MDKLPLELWEEIFSHIDDKQLARLTRVSSGWHHILTADIFWKKRTEAAFGIQHRVSPSKWKARYGREYAMLMDDTKPPAPPTLFPSRFVMLGQAIAAILLCIWAWLLPNLALSFLSSPLPAITAWIGMKWCQKANIKIDKRFPRVMSLPSTYIVSAFMALQALLNWQLSPSACSAAVVTGYALLCNAAVIDDITDSRSELRLLYLLAQWKLMASSSMLQVYLYLFSPLDYFSQQAFTRNIFLLATATKILKPHYLTDSWLQICMASWRM